MENSFPFRFDPTDTAGMKSLMQEFGDSKSPFFGTNEHEEDVTISISRTNITVRTHQKNGWDRVNSYTLDNGEFISDETFDGR